jgi:uncharacterized protein YukE
MTSFSVNHGGMSEVNDGLSGSLQQMRAILGHLDDVLRHMPQAAGGQAVPLWSDLQGRWHGRCDDMNTRLASTHLANINVANAFVDGDNHGARIMM